MSAIAVVKRVATHLARIRYRLLLINLIVAAVPIVGISFANMHERQLLVALEQDMIHQAQLVRAAITTDGTRTLDSHQATLVIAARSTRTRIRILDAAAIVRADSHRGGPPEGAERPVPQLFGESPTHPPEVPKPIDLASRTEIKTALAGRYGAATRLWDNQDRVYLFSALPVVDSRTKQTTAIVYVTRSTHDVKLQLYALRTGLVRLLIASIVGTALLTLLLATTIARPLGQLTRRAKRIAARQPVETPTGDDRLARRRDEVGELARAVGTMTTELERRARDARTLAADISHEFKTPLTGIRGAAELLRDGAAEDPEARDRFLAMIVDDTARLDRLVSRLLELARVDDDRTTQLPLDLAELARQSATARPWPVPVDVRSTQDRGPTSFVVSGRAPALASAIDNLVANATQHADLDTRVTIAITHDRDRVRVSVSNHGPALSDAARTKVWDRFYSTRHVEGGSGLGLAIVRSVVLAHDGTMGVECEGGVTTFWFEISASA
ncbi:MAG: sensor histidine kinase [Kofleriaceae bacterium]